MSDRCIRTVLVGLSFQLLLVTAHPASAIVTTAGGESITWNFQGIPSWSFFSSTTPCSYVAETNYWVCEYGMMDPPYLNAIDFTASITPTTATFPALRLYYSGATDYPYNLITEAQGYGANPISTSASFYIPASAQVFRIMYSSNGAGNGEKNIQINVRIANYDPNRANMFGGDEINADTEFCDEGSQPGKPRIRKFKNRKGAGPGA